MSLSRRIAVLVATILMALMMVAGPVASAADAAAKTTDGGKNRGWGDGEGGGKVHPKKGGSGDPGHG